MSALFWENAVYLYIQSFSHKYLWNAATSNWQEVTGFFQQQLIAVFILKTRFVWLPLALFASGNERHKLKCDHGSPTAGLTNQTYACQNAFYSTIDPVLVWTKYLGCYKSCNTQDRVCSKQFRYLTAVFVRFCSLSFLEVHCRSIVAIIVAAHKQKMSLSQGSLSWKNITNEIHATVGSDYHIVHMIQCCVISVQRLSWKFISYLEAFYCLGVCQTSAKCLGPLPIESLK